MHADSIYVCRGQFNQVQVIPFGACSFDVSTIEQCRRFILLLVKMVCYNSHIGVFLFAHASGQTLFLAHAFRFQESLTHLEKMGEVVVLGGDAGGVHLVNMDTGDLLASPKMEDHDGPVTGLSAHMTLKHFISCGSDGMIKASL